MPNQSKISSPLIRSEIEFGLSLLRQQNLSESVVFSPVSISLCLSLLHAAASGETRNEIREALLRDSTDDKFEEHFSNVYKAIVDATNGTEVNLANHVFCLKDYPIKQSYLDAIHKLYNAGASSLDFINDKQKSAKVMNKFVADSTNGHITKIINPDDFEKDLVAVFTNAVYFKATWLEKFQAGMTYKKDFFNTSQTMRSIDFMRNYTINDYAENDQFGMLRLPYLDESFSMNIFLPKARFGLKDALIKLTPATIQNLLSNTTKEFCHIDIPKWKIESNIDLNKTLQSFGIKLAFDIENEEFRKLAENTHGFSQVAHSAMIEVDEEGTTAAAFTVLRLRGGGCPPRIVEFTADHPFLFILTKDTHPIFMGIYN